ncbi:hypothetical protein F9B85_08475 [Heliorestis acidaminivorans]|uniref:Uncharacterized protein n=2 Tax=Heliorestis acidaminivorans TaxID=553427 RepID=A0A6I0F2U1_9FIRM|nr:hypothetical protein F9B85_08475 [Heliorestis acidaminivorans]
MMMLWEHRRRGVKGIYVHYVVANPAESQVEWVEGIPYGQGDTLLKSLAEDHVIDLTYQEAYYIFEEMRVQLARARVELTEEVQKHWSQVDRPAQLKNSQWQELTQRLVGRRLDAKETVHAYFQGWAIEDWAFVYYLMPPQVQSRHRDHLSYARLMMKKFRGESLLRGIVVDEKETKESNKHHFVADLLVGKENQLLSQRMHFYVEEVEGNWVIQRTRREKAKEIPPGSEPFFQGRWYWRSFVVPSTDQVLDFLRTKEGCHVDENDEGLAIVYVSHMNDATKLGVDVSRDARGQIWIGYREVVIGAISEDRLASLLQELRREKILSRQSGKGPFRLPEAANYLYREGHFDSFEEFVKAWEQEFRRAGEAEGEGITFEASQMGSLLTQFMEWRFGESWNAEWRRFARQSGEDSKTIEEHSQGALFWEWFVFDRLSQKDTTLDVFIDEVGIHLPPMMVTTLKKWRESTPGFFVITSMEEKGFWARDLFRDKSYYIEDSDCKPGEPPYEEGYIIFSRIMIREGKWHYGGVAHFFPRWYRKAIESFMERIGLWDGENFREDQWRNRSWSILIYLVELCKKPIIPKLFTMEGHLAGMSRAVYQVKDYSAVKKTVEKLSEFVFVARERQKDQGEYLRYDWLEHGLTSQLMTSMQELPLTMDSEGIRLSDIFQDSKDGQEVRQVGTLMLHKQYAVIDTISMERLDVLKRVLSKYCGFYLIHDEDFFEEAEVLAQAPLKEKQ